MKKQYVCLRSVIAIIFAFDLSCYSMNISKKGLFDGINTEHIKKQLQSLTLEQKTGQLFVAPVVINPRDPRNIALYGSTPERAHPGYVEELIRNYHIGGIIIQRMSDPTAQVRFITHVQELNKKQSIIPLFIGQDLEFGLATRLFSTVRFPRNMTLGALKDNTLLYSMGKEIGRQCKIIGVHINFAPVVDINTNPANPIIGDRSFGENKEAVAEKGLAIMKGLQDSGIIACAKHFPGHGDTAVDSHLTLPVILHDLKRIDDVELYPFKGLIEEGVKAVMTAHLSVPALNTQDNPATLSKEVVSQLLKDRLGFKGLIVTDGLDMKGVCQGKEEGDPELQALIAGNDILLCSASVPQAVARIKNAIEEGEISEKELDDHISKILASKAWAFAHQEEKPDTEYPEYLHTQLHTEYAYEVKRELYRQAITLVRNDNAILPIKNAPKSISYVQIGPNKKSLFIEELEKYCSLSSYSLSTDASSDDISSLVFQINPKDTVIVGMLGMNRSASQQYGITESVRNALNELRKCNYNVIVVLFGTPYSLKWFENIPAIIMAYEDDPDAQIAAADVLVGKYVPQGKLPVTASPKFPAGTSLSY